MKVFYLLLGIALLGFGCWLLYKIAELVARPLGLSFAGALRKRQFLVYVERAEAGDRMLEAGDVEGALRAFESAFFPFPATTAELSRLVDRHHMGLLNRLLVASEAGTDGSVRLLSLAKVDRMIDERKKLELAYLGARQQGDWSQRISLRQRLRNSTSEIRSALGGLADEIRKVRRSAVYH